jgi:uncharacterized membrane protein
VLSGFFFVLPVDYMRCAALLLAGACAGGCLRPGYGYSVAISGTIQASALSPPFLSQVLSSLVASAVGS